MEDYIRFNTLHFAIASLKLKGTNNTNFNFEEQKAVAQNIALSTSTLLASLFNTQKNVK
jgi:hypothetical protein